MPGFEDVNYDFRKAARIIVAIGRVGWATVLRGV
jgi:hypothetical protein